MSGDAATFELGCMLDYQVPARTALVFNVEAAALGRQLVRAERLTVAPDLPTERFTTPDGNRLLRVVAQPGPLRLEYRAAVALRPLLHDPAAVHEVPQDSLPLPELTYCNPSRYCQSDRLALFAQRTFGRVPPGHHRVGAICNWICDNVEYHSGSSDAMTSAADTLLERQGVCRDFAHLAIALCRALGIPARYVSAYASRLDPPDFHAVFEAYLSGPGGGCWYLFDATRKTATDGLVRIGVGLDAGEVAFCSIFGTTGSEPPQVWITAPDSGALLTTQAVSVSAP